MTPSITVVGSGPSGVHFAQSALERGFRVTLVDVGHAGEAPPLPGVGFEGLKDRLEDPAQYFLGDNYDGVVLPTATREYYGLPPSKNYVFEPLPGFELSTDGFEPLTSFARGGLAEAWTGGCYPFNDAELEAFPFGFAELGRYYDEIARRIGVSGEADDLSRFMPLHAHLLPPLELDPHSARLLRAYQRRRDTINRRHRAWMGRTRVATLTVAHEGREPCGYLGRCLWGCPGNSLYLPSHTLRKLQRDPRFEYRPGFEVLRFRFGASGMVEALVVRPIGGGEERELPVERLALAAGALNTAGIVLRSMAHASGSAPVLHGLMDNRQVLVPFLSLGMLGAAPPETSYQYHLVGMGLDGPRPAEYVHCQVTTLKDAMIHPIAQSLPVDLRSALAIVRATRGGLGVVNVNFHDTRRSGNTVSLENGPGGPRLRVRYAPPEDEPARIAAGLARVRKVLRALGCIVPPGMQHVRPMGASVHYAGVLPMQSSGGGLTTDPSGRSRDFPNLFLADGVTFPFLPAKNLTFTLMANAARIADGIPLAPSD